jgi:hypothetical protein
MSSRHVEAIATLMRQLSRALGRWERLDLICVDELGYVPLAETACVGQHSWTQPAVRLGIGG